MFVLRCGLLIREDDVGMGWKVGELVRNCRRGTGEGFYNEKDCAIANIVRLLSLREHQPENTARRFLVTNKEENAIVHTPRWVLSSKRHNERHRRALFQEHKYDHQASPVSYSAHVHHR